MCDLLLQGVNMLPQRVRLTYVSSGLNSAA